MVSLCCLIVIMVQLSVPRSLILQERDPIEEFAVGVAMVALTSLAISCPVPTLTSQAHLYDFRFAWPLLGHVSPLKFLHFDFKNNFLTPFSNDFPNSNLSNNSHPPNFSTLEFSSPKNHIFNKILLSFPSACNLHNFHDF